MMRNHQSLAAPNGFINEFGSRVTLEDVQNIIEICVAAPGNGEDVLQGLAAR